MSEWYIDNVDQVQRILKNGVHLSFQETLNELILFEAEIKRLKAEYAQLLERDTDNLKRLIAANHVVEAAKDFIKIAPNGLFRSSKKFRVLEEKLIQQKR